MGRLKNPQRMIAPENYGVAAVECEGDSLTGTAALYPHVCRSEGSTLDFDIEFLDWGHENVPPIRFPTQHSREQACHRRPPNRRSVVVPGAVARDAHARVSAALGIPFVDRRQAPLVDHLLQIGEAQALQFDRWSAFRHGSPIGLLRGIAQGRSAAWPM